MITIIVEGDTEEVGLPKLIAREFGDRLPAEKLPRVIKHSGNAILLGNLADDVARSLTGPKDHVFALLDLKGHPVQSAPTEDPVQAIGRLKQAMRDRVRQEHRPRFSPHVVRYEIEAVYLSQPELLHRHYRLPCAHPLYESPEDVNGERGVWLPLQALMLVTPGAPQVPKKTLASRMFAHLDVEKTKDKVPSFYAFWSELREKVDA